MEEGMTREREGQEQRRKPPDLFSSVLSTGQSCRCESHSPFRPQSSHNPTRDHRKKKKKEIRKRRGGRRKEGGGEREEGGGGGRRREGRKRKHESVSEESVQIHGFFPVAAPIFL